MGFINAQGTALYYEEKGNGPSILLIPPSGGTASTWGALTDQLTDIGRVIACHRRGYSRSGGEVVRSATAHTCKRRGVPSAHTVPPRAEAV